MANRFFELLIAVRRTAPAIVVASEESGLSTAYFQKVQVLAQDIQQALALAKDWVNDGDLPWASDFIEIREEMVDVVAWSALQSKPHGVIWSSGKVNHFPSSDVPTAAPSDSAYEFVSGLIDEHTRTGKWR